MLKFDTTTNIVAVIALVALISPILVAIINNIHNGRTHKRELKNIIKTKQLEISYENKKNAFENFISACGNFIQSDAPSATVRDINSKAFVAILYCSEENAKLVKELVETVISSRNYHVSNDDLDNFSKCLLHLSSQFNKELQEAFPYNTKRIIGKKTGNKN